MHYREWAAGLISQLVDFYVRTRNLGLGLVRWSATILVAALGSGFVLELKSNAFGNFRFSSGEGLPVILVSAIVALAAVGLLTGIWLAARVANREEDTAQASRVLVAEMRGLVDTSDHPLLKAVPQKIVGRREDCLVDVRPHLKAAPPNVHAALEELSALATQVRRARGGTDRQHVTVVAGGVMQVPLLFYAGTQLEDEGKTVLMDWERTSGKWQQLLAPDDGTRFTITGVDSCKGHAEVVMAVSATYQVAMDDIAATFPGMPVVHLARPDPQPNTIWSGANQAALTQQFLQTLAQLANRGVKTLHLVLAASSSLSLRFGMAYDHRNMPNLRCYQRERDHVPSYPWSVQMKTAVLPAACVATPNPAVVAA